MASAAASFRPRWCPLPIPEVPVGRNRDSGRAGPARGPPHDALTPFSGPRCNGLLHGNAVAPACGAWLLGHPCAEGAIARDDAAMDLPPSAGAPEAATIAAGTLQRWL